MKKVGRSVKEIVLLASLPIVVMAVLFWHIRLYSLYRFIDARVGDLSYYWFSLQFQTPQLAKLLPDYVDIFASLPADLTTQVATVRRQTGWAEMVIIFRVILFGILIFFQL